MKEKNETMRSHTALKFKASEKHIVPFSRHIATIVNHFTSITAGASAAYSQTA